MSLINDALKRAKQSQQQRRQTAPPAPHLPPVEAAPRNGLVRFFPFAVVLLVAMAGFFIVGFFAMPKPAAQIKPPPHQAQIAIAAPVVQKAPPPPPVQTVAVTAPRPAPPALKVQGIFYNNAKWQAIVNRQSVLVGDSVDGFRVKFISKNNVSFIAPDGTEKIMALGD